MNNRCALGIDIGSTTVKLVLLDENQEKRYGGYRRHHAHIQEALAALLREAVDTTGMENVVAAVCGSGGITLAKQLGLEFVQEVAADQAALELYSPQTDVAVELGGEDAKIIYFTGGLDERMNSICAGGTGSFIDQMAALIQTDAAGLNEFAKGYKTLYPIAARCGVFAKSDIQPLINDGVTREDIAASIFQSVVNQTISGLACGKPIQGNVAFLGGPLHFLSELRAAFIRTLKLTPEQVFAPEDSHLFAATGAALCAGQTETQLSHLIDRLEKGVALDFELRRLEPLFTGEADYAAFRARHDRHQVVKGDLAACDDLCFLGIDAGSTTTKLALIDSEGRLLWSFYSNNNGNPVRTAMRALEDLRSKIPETAVIARSCSTGYGEALLKAAFQLEEGEVETIAHYRAASFFDPELDCILDIGGQDMKCIRIKDGAVDSIMLNEACSSGCGSFIENFANSMGYSAPDFAKEALYAPSPIDLGTRCTVFMNSNVKQAQKEGASLQDISAGLAYSVIKNALFKVIKLTRAEDLGRRIVVQGGTFLNDAVLRAFEKTTGGNAVRPDIAGLMGAFGAALIAMDRYAGQPGTLLSFEEIAALEYTSTSARCGRCQNNCLLTVSHFGGGRRFISGNRCERGLGGEVQKKDIPNMYAWKLKRIFDYEPLPADQAPRGVIGLPRVMNVYENFPFWAVFFRELGFSLQVSPLSTHSLYELGIHSIPSETACYPAKLAHGHIHWLINQGIKTIFYPAVISERKENEDGPFHYNCPVVSCYPENIRNNVTEVMNGEVKLIVPFMTFLDEKAAAMELCTVFHDEFGIGKSAVRAAVAAGWKELLAVRAEITAEGKRVLAWMEETGTPGIVLAGRPYHIDPEINHGIPEMITSYNFAVLSEDSVSEMASLDGPLRVIDQWMYQYRLYAAAQFVKKRDDVDLVEITSFGCGLDAITADQVQEILSGSGKLFTLIKIDEMNNLGAARIRIRSLIAAIRIRREKNEQRAIQPYGFPRTEFTKDMKDGGYTILCPPVAPIHFRLLETVMAKHGYHMVMLNNNNHKAIDTGLRYVNNDACYPAMVMVGQAMDAILSGKYDTDRLAVFMFQSGGACRVSTYLPFLRRALAREGLGHIPVISISMNRQEVNPGFKMSPALMVDIMKIGVMGDLLMKVVHRTRPYEAEPGSVNALCDKWVEKCAHVILHGNMHGYRETIAQIVRDFDAIPIREDVRKPKVGIVGEIYVKYLPLANNNLIELLEREGAEVHLPELMTLIAVYMFNYDFKARHLGARKVTIPISQIGLKTMQFFHKPAKQALEQSRRFHPPIRVPQLAGYAEEYISLGVHSGEGWLLSGEIVELVKDGVDNIVSCQPFACMPAHICNKGVMKRVRETLPGLNIVAIDYDPGASEVNQLNRIKLLMTTARKKLAEELAEEEAENTAAAG